MKCISLRPCQARRVSDNKIVTYDKAGMVDDFKKCPEHFQPLADAQEDLDFKTASEDFLMEAEFELDDLKTFIEDTFGIKTGNKGKEKTIKALIDARYRDL